MPTKLVTLFLLLAAPLALLAGPGQHSVVLTWTASPTAGVTYNLYRGAAAGVCSGNPTPYATGIASTTFTDTVNLADGQTIFYNVATVKGGAISACDGELQVLIPVLPAPASNLGATVQ